MRAVPSVEFFIMQPHNRFGHVLVGGWILLFLGTLLIFIFPHMFAPILIKAVWLLSISLVLATFAYGVLRVFTRKNRA